MKPDIVYIHNLEIYTTIGVFAWERKIKQMLCIDLEMQTDICKAAATDQLNAALDYKKISKAVIEFVETHHFQLIETFAESIAKLLIKDFAVQKLAMRISKPGAVRYSKDVGIMIERSVQDYN